MKIVKTDLPFTHIITLAALGVPRVILHDLKLVSFDSPIYKVLAVGPLLIWLLVAIFYKTKSPFHLFIVLGLMFGLLLGVTHQMTWVASWGDNMPHLHGNLEGKLDPTLESLLLRTAAFISSIFTGLFAGVVLGAVSFMSQKVRAKAK
jgi:hypothetical protein